MSIELVTRLLEANNKYCAQIEINNEDIDSFILSIKEELKRVALEWAMSENELHIAKYGGWGSHGTNTSKYSFSLSLQGEIYIRVEWYETWAYGGHDEGSFEFPYSLLIKENLDKYLAETKQKTELVKKEKNEEWLKNKKKEADRLLQEIRAREMQ